jgi:hypothetical protein
MKTLQPSAPPASAGNGSGTVPSVVKARRRVPPTVVGLLVGALALGVFVVLTPAGSRSSPVLALARGVPAGDRLSASDLKVVSLQLPRDLAVIRAADVSSVVGQVAEVDLAAGELLAPGQVGAPLGSMSEVGLVLKPGQYPPGVAPTDQVEVLNAPGSVDSTVTSGSASGTVLAPVAVVESVSPAATDPSTLLVGLRVSAAEAVTVAEAAAAGRVVLVVQR